MLEIYQKAQRKLLEQGWDSSVMASSRFNPYFYMINEALDCFIVDEWRRDIEFIAEHGVKFASHYQAVKYEQ